LRRLQVQPFQAFSIAFVLVGIGLLAMPADAIAQRRMSRTLRIEGVPLASMMRRITETTRLTVPEGEVFVVMGLARHATSPLAYRIDVSSIARPRSRRASPTTPKERAG
jgi:hypothetical protein